MASNPPVGTLSPGSRVGPYEIQSLLGEGGMGQVYRARDPRLGRDVAIKLLPEAVALDADRSARFEREARTLAALNHPHIAAIYGIEHLPLIRALVLELVEGETLAQKIATKLSLADSLTIAGQIADALEAAHEKGIIHRDLKPANVMIQSRRALQAKVLDFGLARVDGTIDSRPDLSPTETFEGTKRGLILGTAAYMSPEQARGRPLDKRTDIWSFGCVLYEMLTGRRAFAGDTASDSIAAIIERQPDWNALPKSTPPRVRRLLERCLEKDASRRPRDIGDVRLELEHELASLSRVRDSAAEPPFRAGRDRAMWIAAGAAVVAVLGGIGVWIGRTSSAVVPPPPAVQLTDFADAVVRPSISPDGRWLTFVRGGTFFGSSSARGDVYVKLLTGDEPPLQLTHEEGFGTDTPTFSPDGSKIVYTRLTNGFKWDSWQVGVLGQSPARPFLTNASGLVWLGEHRVLFSEIIEGVHMKIVTSSDTRSDMRDIYVPHGQGSMAHRTARSPDGRSLLVAEMDGTGWLPCRLMPFDGSSTGRPVGPLDGQCVTAAWSPDGQWMYFSSNSGGGFHIWRQRFPSGAPEQITFPPTEQEGTAITPDGKFLITSQGLQQAGLWMHDENGDRQLTAAGFAMLPIMNPSGDRMFYLMRSGAQKTFVAGELWSMDLPSGEKRRLLPGVIMSGYSITSDARRVVYTSSGVADGDGVWIASLDPQNRTPPRRLTHGGEFRAFASGSDDIVFMSQGDRRYLYRMKEDGSNVRKISEQPILYLVSASPDGRWVIATMPLAPNVDGWKIVFLSTRGEAPYTACDECVVGFAARSHFSTMAWGLDGKSVVIALRMYGMQTQRSVILPYNSSDRLEVLWPKGLKTEAAVLANPGAVLVGEGSVYPAARPSTYLYWRLNVLANLWKIPLPN